MKQRTFFGSFALALLSSACSANLDSYGPLELAATDPSLLEEAKLFVFSFSRETPCSEIVNLEPRAIGDLISAENPPAPVQPIENGVATEHVFGNVPPNTPIAYFVMASAKGRDEFARPRITLADLNDSVYAIACKDFSAPSGARRDLPMSLFPVGLR